MRRVGHVILAAWVGAAASAASAEFIASFEPPDYNGSAAGTVLTGQQGWYLPAGINAHVYTYATNTLGLTAANPTGGTQFGAGLRVADSARAQHDYNFVADQIVMIGYDFNCSFLSGTPPTSGWCGSISLQPSSTSQSMMSMRQWTTNVPPACQIIYGVYTNAAEPTTSSYTPVIFGNLPTDHWFREEILIDFDAHRVLEVALTDLETSVRTVYTAPPNWYLRGGPNPAEPLPTGLRFFTASPDNNILAYDNLVMDAALVNNADGATDIGTASATFNGYLLATSGVTEATLYWGPTDGGTNAVAWSNSIAFGPQSAGQTSLSTNLTGLSADTWYYYRFYATDGSWSEWAADTELFATRAYDNFYDDFEPYANGSQIADQGNWIYWDDDPNDPNNGGAFVTNSPSLSGTNSLEAGGIAGIGSGKDTDVVWQYGPLTNGTWTFRAMLYIPSTSTNGEPWLGWLRDHPAEGTAVEGMAFDLAGGLVEGGPVQIVRDRWAEVRAVLRLDELAVDTYYDGNLVAENATWTGLRQVNGLDVWCDNAVGGGVAPVYLDDLSASNSHYGHAPCDLVSQEREIWEKRPAFSPKSPAPATQGRRGRGHNENCCLSAERMYIENTDITNLTATSATLNGELMETKGATEVRLYWGSTDGGTDPNAWEHAILMGTQSVGQVSTNITGLVGGSQYYYRYFADSLSWDEWAHETATFETLSTPTVDNQAPTFLANGTARLRGGFANQNRADITICWGMSDGGTNTADWDHVVPLGTQPNARFFTDVSGLLFPNTYYYTCYATNAYGDDWADSSTNFTTLGPQPDYPSGSLNYGLYNGAANTQLGAIDDGLANGQNGGLFSLTPSTSQKWTGEVWQGGNTADYYCQMWSGYFLPPLTGTYTFYVHGDDYEALWIDTDISGEFERATDLVSDNTPESGESWNTPHTETVYLESGVGHAIAIAHNEGGGGDWVNLTITPPGSSSQRVNPGSPDQADWWWDRHVVRFSTLDVTNRLPEDVTGDSATLRGTLSSTASIYDAWVFWGPTDRSTNSATWTNRAFLGTYTNASDVALAHPISGLAAGSTNYYTFRASNVLHTGWAAPSAMFETVDVAPVVSNLAALTDIGSATLRGELTDGNAADVAIYWGRSDGETNKAAWDSVVRLDDMLEGPFSSAVNAGYGATFYFRCYATNTAGDAWADSTTNFTTLSPVVEPGVPVTSGLVVRWDAGSIGVADGAQVDAWENSQNPGTYDLTRSGGSPKYDAVVPGLNDKPAVLFSTGGNDWFSFSRINTIRTAFWVLRDARAAANEQFMMGDLGTYHFHNVGARIWHGSHAHANIRNGSTELNGTVVDGVNTDRPTDFGIISVVTTGNVQGNQLSRDRSNDGRSWEGEMAEVLIYDQPLSAEDEDLVGSFLTWKYGLTTAYPESYTPPVPFAIANTIVSDVSSNAATLNAALSATGWVFDVYAYWGATNGGTVATNWDSNAYVGAITNAAGALSYRVSGLPGDTAHYYTFKATNDATNVWAVPSAHFRTLGTPTVSNTPATDITQTSATLNGDLVRGGTGEATIYWGLADGGTTPSAWGNTSVVGTVVGPFDTTVPVVAGGVYYYRCYVTNSLNEDWADSTEEFRADYAEVSLDIAVNMPDLGLSPTNVSGCIFWIAGDDIDGDGDTGNNPTNGASVNVWADKSGLGHDVSRVGLVDPSLNTNGPNGRSVVTFDADQDYMATTYNFDPHTEYTIFSVARYSGGDNERVISSATRNWRFGFHGNGTERWYAEGWIYAGPTGNADANWHIHAGHIDSDPDPKASFWADGLLRVADGTGSGAGNHMIGRLALGGYRSNNEESNCEVAEILVFDRVLTGNELRYVGLYLENKYKLGTAYAAGGADVTEARGTFEVTAMLSAPAISNVTVNFAFGGAAVGGRLIHKGYHVQPQADMDLNNNGGLMALTPYGTATLTVGPAGRGLDFNNDADFINSGAINQNDNYMNLFLGYFTPQETGTFEFRRGADDDRMGIWLDLDRDGVFESTTAGLGSNRGEQLQWDSDGGAKSVTLTEGLSYMFAVTHGEYGGGSQVDVRFKTPSMAAETVIKPADPDQYGMWSDSTNATTYPADFTCNTSVEIPAGSLSAAVTVTPVDDLEQEEDEGGRISIDSVVNAAAGSPDSVMLSISSTDPEVVNGAATDVTDGTAVLNGTLSMGDYATVSVYWGTTDGGTDRSQWEATNVLGFAAEDEPFAVALTGLTGGQTYYYRCYATNDSNLGEDWADATTNFTTDLPLLSVDDISVAEGDSGNVPAVFTIGLSAPTVTDVTADYGTIDGTARTADGDYTAVSGSLRIPAGSLSTQITVLVHGDTLPENPPESFGMQLSAVAGGATVGSNPGTCVIMDDDASTYLASWKYRMPITFSGYSGGETLTNWPALIRLSENLPDFLYDSFGSPTGGDLRFADAGVKALLSFEIELWDATGESAVWVQVPELSGSNTMIWAYWGNPANTNLPSYATDGSTWDETFAAVYHLTSACDDSTANANHAPINAGAPTIAAGNVIGQAYDFDGSSRFRAPDAPSLDLEDGCTMSGWFNCRELIQWRGMIAKGNDSAYELENGRGASNFRIRINNPGDAASAQINSWSANTWYYIVGTYDMQNTRLYRNGVLGNTRPLTQTINQNDEGLTIGARHNNNFVGVLDEWRLSNVARGADWIQASYDNQVKPSTFTEYGDVWHKPGTLLIVR